MSPCNEGDLIKLIGNWGDDGYLWCIRCIREE